MLTRVLTNRSFQAAVATAAVSAVLFPVAGAYYSAIEAVTGSELFAYTIVPVVEISAFAYLFNGKLNRGYTIVVEGGISYIGAGVELLRATFKKSSKTGDRKKRE